MKRNLCLAVVAIAVLATVFFCGKALTGWLSGHREPAKGAAVKIDPIGTWAKKLESPWVDSKVVLYRATGEVVELDAKKAAYTIWSIKDPEHPGKKFKPSTIMAFRDPKTGHAWIGRLDADETETNEFRNSDGSISPQFLVCSNLFFENDSRIFRTLSVIYEGKFDCLETALKSQPGETLDSFTHRFDQNTNGSWPDWGTSWTTSFESNFREGFFFAGNLMDMQIQRFQITNGTLRLDFNSLTYRNAGSVWLDLKTLNVLKTAEDKPK